MNLLVIRLSSLGDVVIVSSLLEYLSLYHPRYEVTLVTGAEYAGLFRCDPRLVSVVPYTRRAPDLNNQSLQRQQWDRIIDLQGNRYSRDIISRLRFHAGAVSVIKKRYAQRWLLLLFRINRYPPGDSVAGRYLRCAGADPGTVAQPPSLRVYHPDQGLPTELDREMNCGSPTLALFPFAAWRNKEWLAENFAAVACAFAEIGWRVVLFGNERERDRSERLCRRIGPACLNATGTTTIDRAAGLIRTCALALGNDTGLAHLARACGVRTGIIYGATTRHFGFFPFGDPSYCIFESETACRPCHAHGGNFCPRLNRVCLRRIDPGYVFERMRDLAGT